MSTMEWGNGESIYNLIPKETTKKERSVKYKSKFNQSANEADSSDEQHKSNYNYNTHKAPNNNDTNNNNGNNNVTKLSRTMGPAKVKLRGPEHFLRGKEKNFTLPEGGFFKYNDENRKAQVPKLSEKPLMGLRKDVNYIEENAIKNIKSVAKVPMRNMVDSCKGNKQNLQVAGLEPVFVFKKEYGKTPEYLEKRKEELVRNEEYLKAYMKERGREGEMSVMSEGDKEKIIKGLKENWDFVYKEYLGLPMVIDTPAKKQHKERLEASMKQLEADVRLLEGHHTIYVTDY